MITGLGRRVHRLGALDCLESAICFLVSARPCSFRSLARSPTSRSSFTARSFRRYFLAWGNGIRVGLAQWCCVLLCGLSRGSVVATYQLPCLPPPASVSVPPPAFRVCTIPHVMPTPTPTLALSSSLALLILHLLTRSK